MRPSDCHHQSDRRYPLRVLELTSGLHSETYVHCAGAAISEICGNNWAGACRGVYGLRVDCVAVSGDWRLIIGHEVVWVICRARTANPFVRFSWSGLAGQPDLRRGFRVVLTNMCWWWKTCGPLAARPARPFACWKRAALFRWYCGRADERSGGKIELPVRTEASGGAWAIKATMPPNALYAATAAWPSSRAAALPAPGPEGTTDAHD